jgi:integrase
LASAYEVRTSASMVEYAGLRVVSIKRFFRDAVARAGIGNGVTPHTLGHSLIAWMARDAGAGGSNPLTPTSRLRGLTA